MRKRLLFVISLLFVAGIIAAYRSSQDYTKYMILGKTEEEYLNIIKANLLFTYAPKKDVPPQDIERVWEPYMTEKCIKRFSTPNEASQVKPEDVNAEIQYIGLAYGKFQKDNIPRVIAKLRVETKTRFWVFHLEMKLNSEGKIYEVQAYY